MHEMEIQPHDAKEALAKHVLQEEVDNSSFSSISSQLRHHVVFFLSKFG